MFKRPYTEPELRTNRSSLLLYGATEADRRLWAEEAAAQLAPASPLRVVSRPQELTGALADSEGVVYLPEVAVLGIVGQAQLVHCLHRQEERPKLVLGLSRNPASAVERGELRDDLLFRLSYAQVNLDTPGTLEALKGRRAAKPAGKGQPASRQRASKAVPRAKAAAKHKRR